MHSSLFDSENLTENPFDELSGYEKGAVARAFLSSLIKYGKFEEGLSDDSPDAILFPFREWQLKLLACFLDDEDDEECDDNEILLDRLCQLF